MFLAPLGGWIGRNWKTILQTIGVIERLLPKARDRVVRSQDNFRAMMEVLKKHADQWKSLAQALRRLRLVLIILYILVGISLLLGLVNLYLILRA